MTDKAYPNEGHGHVFPRPDGLLAKCGGPKICLDCAIDQSHKIAAEAKGAETDRASRPAAGSGISDAQIDDAITRLGFREEYRGVLRDFARALLAMAPATSQPDMGAKLANGEVAWPFPAGATTQTQEAAPAGYVLVPSTPTAEMQDACLAIVDLTQSDPEDHRYDDGRSTVDQLYAAMLAAAPTQPQPEHEPAEVQVTPVMIAAGAQAARECMERTGGNDPAVIYRAMHALAPSAPVEAVTASGDERAAFEATFPVPGAVVWSGAAYEVREGWENSYAADRYLAAWSAWQAARRAQHSTAEPVATLHDDGYYTFKRGQEPQGARHAGWRMDVFAAPQQAPLTDEQIDRIWSNSTPSNFEARSFARAIERALGISAAKETSNG